MNQKKTIEKTEKEKSRERVAKHRKKLREGAEIHLKTLNKKQINKIILEIKGLLKMDNNCFPDELLSDKRFNEMVNDENIFFIRGFFIGRIMK